MKKLIVLTLVGGVFLLMSATTVLAKNEVFKGGAEDPYHPELGSIRYVGTKTGYHFWFTPTEDIYLYTANHSYHNIYKIEVENPSEWCGKAYIPNRTPYNLVGHTGKTTYFKVWDVTTGTSVCP